MRSLCDTKDPATALAALARGDLNGKSLAGVAVKNGLLFVGDRLCVPRVPELREALYQLAHDSMGHFGSEKTYALLHHSYYWPHMRRDLEALDVYLKRNDLGPTT